MRVDDCCMAAKVVCHVGSREVGVVHWVFIDSTALTDGVIDISTRHTRAHTPPSNEELVASALSLPFFLSRVVLYSKSQTLQSSFSEICRKGGNVVLPASDHHLLDGRYREPRVRLRDAADGSQFTVFQQ